MRKIFIISALTLGIATAAGAAIASDHKARADAPPDQRLTTAQITEKFTSQGYDVRNVKAESGGYEIHAVGKDGRRLKAYVHPTTGEPIRKEDDD